MVIVGRATDFWFGLCWVGILFLGLCFLSGFSECVGSLLSVILASLAGMLTGNACWCWRQGKRDAMEKVCCSTRSDPVDWI